MSEPDAIVVESDVVVTRAIMNPTEWGIYALCYMQVCAHSECPPELIEQRANELNPNGLRHAWKLTSKGPDDADLAPILCEKDPARIHYMLSC